MVAKLPAAFARPPPPLPSCFRSRELLSPSSFLPSIPPETEFLLQPCLSPPTTLPPLVTRSTGCPSRNRVNATLQDPNLPPPLPDLLLLRLLLLRMCRACACCLRARARPRLRASSPRVRRWRTRKKGRTRRRQRPSSFLLSSLARSLTVVARSPSPSLYPSISSERSRWSKGRRMSTKPYLQQISWEQYLLSQRPKL